MTWICSCVKQIELLTDYIPYTWIWGPKANQQASALSREPITKYTKVHCPSEWLQSAINTFDDEIYWEPLDLTFRLDIHQRAKRNLNKSDHYILPKDQLRLFNPVSKLTQKYASQRVEKKESRIHVWNGPVLKPVV